MSSYEEHISKLVNELTSIDLRYTQQINLNCPQKWLSILTSISEISRRFLGPERWWYRHSTSCYIWWIDVFFSPLFWLSFSDETWWNMVKFWMETLWKLIYINMKFIYLYYNGLCCLKLTPPYFFLYCLLEISLPFPSDLLKALTKVFYLKKGEVQYEWKSPSLGREISSVVMQMTKDKIFVGCGQSIHGFTRRLDSESRRFTSSVFCDVVKVVETVFCFVSLLSFVFGGGWLLFIVFSFKLMSRWVVSKVFFRTCSSRFGW